MDEVLAAGESTGANVRVFGHMELATSRLRRFRGLLGRACCEGVLLFAPCHDVHTFGMKVPLDIAFVDQGGRVVAAYRDVGPRRRLACPGAAAVVERAADGGEVWLEAGDRLGLAACPGKEGEGL